jgi:hypothetical protein
MIETTTTFQPYATVHTDAAKSTRKELPTDAKLALMDVLDALAENPDAFPGRTRAVSRNGCTRVYTHPRPSLQITYEIDREARVLYITHFVAPKIQVTKPVFISYCHKDARWLDKLKEFLGPLEAQGLVRVWDDTDLKPGADWLQDIKESLDSARVAVFLVTQSFLNSEFIRETELPPLLERAKNNGCLVFWVAVSFSTVNDSEIAKYQAANDPNRPLDTLPEPEQNRVFMTIYERLKAALVGA